MADSAHALVFWRTQHSMLTLEELATAAGLHPEVVEKFISCGLIDPSPGAGPRPLFAPSAQERLGCIVRLRHDLGVNVAGLAVILEMREHLKDLQRELQRLRRRVGLEQ